MVAVIAAAIAVAAIALTHEIAERRALRRALPTMEGELAVASIDGALTILRDGHGVPHVIARSERDAWFGLGFAQAQDRLAQMTYLVRAARGRTGRLQRMHLRMWTTGPLMPTLAEHRVAACDHTTHHRVRTGGVGTPLGQTQGMRHVQMVGGGKLGGTHVDAIPRGRRTGVR